MDTENSVLVMEADLQRLRQAQRDDGFPNAAVRKDRLQRCIDLLVDHQDALVAALDKDYGGRSPYLSKMSEVMQPIGHLKHAIKHVDKWMKPEKRKAMFPMGLLGGKARIEYQPKGVVGIMSPWNFPLAMIFHPLSNALAAGNRVMIKPSEFNPVTAALVADLFSKYFSADEIVVVTGGPEMGGAFSALPLDHILFTGASSIGKKVMEAASRNLTPVTLELGGKSPTIVAADVDITKAAAKIITGKTMNSGQVCLSPDYTFVPEASLDSFIAAATDTFTELYPTVSGNGDYAAMINLRHYERMVSYIEEARAAGVQVVALSEDVYTPDEQRIPVHLVINPGDELKVSQDEIFGPLMIVRTYRELSECVNYINDRPHPLGLYFFGDNPQEQDYVLKNTLSGGVTINDVIFHIANIDLPFGGVGNSGLGNYQGREGFKTFSHARSVYKQGWVDLGKLGGTNPPYAAGKLDKLLAGQIKK
ncbi:coniferyl aldehyde dehydrogenase [Halieaceae bacterium IMCC14734]|uniref:Aldehyde dehydrogenase n=1 Tax=Candidatus Litorirhabdus singularis TaxID=2518993 RepID=A0ABT3TDG1_9GAMM|nr:coniferyl aldehyde dehydrogenase [Candidatus Litorirhabdus singularis]MCX2980350.1 coniferyl aldehyde dehydrogenase [Candidatus Litorirhabdus singularis]